MEPLTDSPSWAAGHRDSAGKRVDHALGSRREAMAEADAGVEIAENLAAFWGSGATLVCSRGWLFCGTRLQTLATVYAAMPHRMLIIVQDPNAAATLVRIAVGTGDLQGADGYRGTRRPPRARRRTGRHDRRHRRPPPRYDAWASRPTSRRSPRARRRTTPAKNSSPASNAFLVQPSPQN
jgi:hypothetical protein